MQAKDNKMEHIGKIVAYLILAINAFFVGTLILSAYSPYLNPKLNPLSSGLGACISTIFGNQYRFYHFLGIHQLPVCFSTANRFFGLLSADKDLYSFQFHYQDNPGRKYQNSFL